MKKSIVIATLCLGFVLPQSVLADSKFDGLYAGVQAGYVEGKEKGKEYDDGDASGYTQKTKPDSGLIGGFVGFNKVLENNI